jgi:N-acetyl-gamma-glutamyl-phosphate reductase
MKKNKIKAGIIGGAGYVGGETLRLLLLHPQVEVIFTQSKSQAGKPVTSVHKDCLGLTDLKFTAQWNDAIDVLFICSGHGEAKKWLTANSQQLIASTRIIDLSQDFRYKETNSFQKRKFIYGLPELNKAAIKKADNIANPGCFATCIQLGLLPLAANNQIHSDIHISAITGSTGAGQTLSETTHFSWRQNNISPYKIFEHQHLKEITESLIQANNNKPLANSNELKFVPYKGAFTRGILATIYLKSDLSEKKALELFHTFYKSSPFVHIAFFDVDVKQVINTNNCFLNIKKIGEELVVISAIDNLLKGAAGQAVQNMNLMFGIDETTGLRLKPSAF